jgi:hypothetical protein
MARTKKHERMAREREQRKKDEDALATFRRLMGRSEERHKHRCSKFRDRHDAYIGKMTDAEKARWQTPVAPAFARHSIEVLISNLLERNVGRVLPWGPEDAETAKCLEKVLAKYRDLDDREEADDGFAREMTVMGVGVQLVLWAYRLETRDYTRWVSTADGKYERNTVRETRPAVDRPTVENLPVYDWFPDPSASRQKQLGWFVDRSWVSMEWLKQFEREERDDGTVYGQFRNLHLVAESSSEAMAEESKKLTGRDHGDCIELCRLWTPSGLVYVANRSVIVCNDPFPFDDGELPISVAHTVKDLYTMDGMSVAEIIAPLQSAAWEVLNALIQNTRIASMLLVQKRRDADIDDDALELATQDVVEVEQIGQDLEFWHAPSTVLDAGLQMLQVLKTTMQEVSGANAYLAGGASETIDQRTATGISIVQSMAQKLLQSWQRSLRRSFRKAGRMEIRRLQQYMRRSEKVRLEGDDGYDYFELLPWELRNEYDYTYSAIDENLNDQQRKAEAGLLFDRVLTVAGHPALQQEGAVVKLRRVVEDLLEAHGKVDLESYIGEAPPPPIVLPPGVMPPGDPGAPAGAPPAPGTPAGAGAGGAILPLPGVAA